MKKVLFITMISLVLFTTGCGKKVENVETKIPTVADKSHIGKVGNVSIVISPVKYENGISTIYATITNDDNEAKYVDSFDVIFNISSEESYTVKFVIGEELQAGQSVSVTNTFNADLSNSVSISYKISNMEKEPERIIRQEEYE